MIDEKVIQDWNYYYKKGKTLAEALNNFTQVVFNNQGDMSHTQEDAFKAGVSDNLGAFVVW